MGKENQDYYKVAGRSTGPAGPLHQFKEVVSRSRSELQRASGQKPGRGGGKRGTTPTDAPAVAETEQQLADLHGEPQRHSVLDDLPRPVGAAGVPAGRRPADPHPRRPERTPGEGEVTSAADEGHVAFVPHDVDGAQDFGEPADYTLAEKTAAPWARGDRGQEAPVKLSPFQDRAIRVFAPALRLLGGAADVVDRPVRRALVVLRWLGREARSRS